MLFRRHTPRLVQSLKVRMEDDVPCDASTCIIRVDAKIYHAKRQRLGLERGFRDAQTIRVKLPTAFETDSNFRFVDSNLW